MSNLYMAWDNANGRADWLLPTDPAYASSGPLQTAVIVSLFSDRVATADQFYDDNTNDPRGWWADSYTGTPIGSLLETLRRAVKSNAPATLRLAESFASQALAWLVTKNVAASVTCKAAWLDGTALLLDVTIVKPDGTTTKFQFQRAWAAV